ncbi:MAG: hypothetical protein AUG87_00160 [Candidatus Rokubacteria bacterium 13_1_20CM_4_70_14]|nr:MAG: hypothetical protein AUG87_00160 [Candidatus Rokubacteria bacterium 13_1_20CM_4_70_14]
MSPGRAALGGVSVGDGLSVVAVGVVNLSPESFHAGSVYTRDDDLLGAALGMVEAGAALIVVGARSTAPYLDAALDEAEERDRLVRAVELLARKLPVPISADTARPAPARAALDASDAEVTAPGWRGAATGQADAARVVERPRPGPPVDPVEHVMGLLRAALGRARAAGIPEERIVVDPGIGFFRDEGIPWHEWDARVLAGLGGLNELGRPVCVGVSRKSFIGAITGRQRPAERLAGSLAATAIAVRNGAAVIRTHDPAETLDAIRVAERLGRAGAP